MNELPLVSPASRILLALACVATFVLLFAYIYFSPFGMDFTDEGFYLNWYKNPGLYPAMVTFFGFVYSLPYRLLGENIVALRIANIVSIFVAGAWCTNQAFSGLSTLGDHPIRLVTRLSLVFSISGLSLLGVGISTSPSYNHLALVGCFLVAGSLLRIGPVLWNSGISNFSIGFPLSAGIVIAALAKPTTGFALGAIVFGYALLCKRIIRSLILKSLVISAIVTILLASFFSGGLPSLFDKTLLGKQWIALLDGGHDIKGLAESVIQAISYPRLLPFAFVLLLQQKIIDLFARASDSRSRVFAIVSGTACFTLLLFSISPMASVLARGAVFTISWLWFFAMPISLILYIIIDAIYGSETTRSSLPIGSPASATRLALIMLLPFAYGFGSNTGIWGKAVSASLIFICIAAYLLLHLPPRFLRSTLSGFLVCYLAGSALIAQSHAGQYIHYPYRQPQPLYQNRSSTTVGKASLLRLSDGFSEYIKIARSALLANGYEPGTPILDLSGQSPGLIYALEGRAVGQAWMIGGYKGSNLLGQKALAKIPCKDLRSAWLIVEVGGPRSLDLSILVPYGIDINDSSKYAKVVELKVPFGAGGYELPRQQIIFKPTMAQESIPQCQ